MKKIFLFLLIFMLASLPVQARNAQRKKSSGNLTTSQSIKAGAGQVFGLTFIATGTNAFATVYDYAGSDSAAVLAEKVLAEAGDAAQYTTKYVNLGDLGIVAEKGLYLLLNNATAIIHYY